MGYKAFVLAAVLLLVSSLIYPGSQSGQDNPFLPYPNPMELYVGSIYASLNDSSINPEAFKLGVIGHQSLIRKGIVSKDNLITVIDYTLPSSEKRFYVIDLISKSIVFKTLVAHGRNSGELYASQFSNRPQSHQSALGFYITGSPYYGGQGFSLLMNGVDTGFNENARKRSIVIHGADYVTHKYIERNGRLGRSFGCPALPPDQNESVIDLIKDGSVIFSYYPDDQYFSNSRVLGFLKKSTAVNNTF